MNENVTKKLVIISDDKTCLKSLQESAEKMGYEIGRAVAPDAGPLPEPASVSIWLLYLSDEDQWENLIDELIEQDDVPVLFGSTQVPPPSSTDFMRWKRHLLEKISEQIGPPECIEQISTSLSQVQEQTSCSSEKPSSLALPDTEEPAKYIATCNEEVCRVWVLGASLGGPTAVKEFLDALPEDLPVAFILAQHIDKGFQKVLVQVLGRHSTFELSKQTIGAQVEYGKVYIAPVETTFDIEEGYFVAKDADWQAPYAPCIDQVMDITSKYYGAHCGSILFSGMGSDGAIAGPEQVKRGGIVWAQTAVSCANSSMPDSAREAGCVTYSATPKQLALQLTARIRKELKELKKAETNPVQQATG